MTTTKKAAAIAAILGPQPSAHLATSSDACALSDHDWAILQSRWARGIDWCVRRLGRRWTVGETFAPLVNPGPRGWPLWETKGACFEALTALVCAESRRRAQVQS